MTFLQLVQKAISESGTIPNAGPVGSASARPTSLAAATGMELKWIAWVQDAWRDLQLSQQRWKWMRRSGTASITSGGGATYTPAQLSLTRVAEWIPLTDDGAQAFSLYLTATGVSDELEIKFIPWERFFATYVRGTQPDAGRPYYFTIDADESLVFYPAPSATYTVRTLYHRTPQVMTADADEPEMPARYHDLIWLGALKKGDLYDEATTRYPALGQINNGLMAQLVRDQLPRWGSAAPLA